MKIATKTRRREKPFLHDSVANALTVTNLTFAVKKNKEQMPDIYRKRIDPRAAYIVGSCPGFCCLPGYVPGSVIGTCYGVDSFERH